VVGSLFILSGGISFVERAGSDDPLVTLAQLRQLCTEDNPYEESVRLNMSNQGVELRQQRAGQWSIRSQLEIEQIESPYELKRRRQKECLRDLRRYMKQDGRFATLMHQNRYMRPGLARDKAVEDLWISIYNGYHLDDPDLLHLRS
jgi:hypothetical protein